MYGTKIVDFGRLTAWNNNQVTDVPSEIIYLEDMESKNIWSLGVNPTPDNNDYYITYGFGYSKYMHTSNGILQEVKMFVPKEDSIKVQILHLENKLAKRKEIKLIYCVKPVLDEDEIRANGYIDLKHNSNINVLTLQNQTKEENNRTIMYISCSEKISSFTGNKASFIGNGTIKNPEGIRKIELDKENSLGKDEMVVIEARITLEALESKDIVITLGADTNLLELQDTAYKYTNPNNAISELEATKKYWSGLLGNLKVDTPIESMNILLNGWLLYQTLCSRMFARSGYYQSGGAYGFRDQLQDCVGLKYISPEILRKQIIKHSEHQFIEGDVEHWWHEETPRGIRTRFSDDLLWLPYMVAEYIRFTGDSKILEEETSYVKGNILPDGIDERYDLYLKSEKKETIYMHCIRAIEKSLNFGENGLPKIGSGDWNDGFSNVGNKGRGESVWLGFFQYVVLEKFVELCEKYGEKLEENLQLNAINNNNIENQVVSKIDEKVMNTIINSTEQNNESVVGNITNGVNQNDEIIVDKITNGAKQNFSKQELVQNRVQKYKKVMEALKRHLNTNGWDGRWYKRAFMDDGNVLGSIQNEECRIDSIAQSWATISGAGDNDKKYISLNSLENHLVDKEAGIIKLLDPPFEKSKLEPGYIKAYIPGTRENGGQYTHAAVWTIIAEAMLGFGDKATEFFRMINPIEHARTKDEANKYKVEPYVIPADIYGGELAGRGGWTWYTGSSSWMYEAGIRYILGFNLEKNILKIEPHIPESWKEYSIRYKYGNSIYNIKVVNKNPNGNKRIRIDGREIEGDEIILQDNGGIYSVEVTG